MINILPPALKQQQRYGRYNYQLWHYLLLAALLLVLLAVVIGGSFWYAGQQGRSYEATLKQKQAENQQYAEVEKNVQNMQSNVALIEKLFNEKTQYSRLLSDIGGLLPPGAYVSKISLSGDDKKPLEMSAVVNSFNDAAVARNSLASSPRFKTVDIQTITAAQGKFLVEFSIAFKEGQAR
jgi:Tfp pilus assembly protein PilN